MSPPIPCQLVPSGQWADAEADCLKRCFQGYADNIATPEQAPKDPKAGFKRCCEACRQARRDAENG